MNLFKYNNKYGQIPLFFPVEEKLLKIEKVRLLKRQHIECFDPFTEITQRKKEFAIDSKY